MKQSISPLKTAGLRLVQILAPPVHTMQPNCLGEPNDRLRRPSSNPRHLVASNDADEDFRNLTITRREGSRDPVPSMVGIALDRRPRLRSGHSRGGSAYERFESSVGPDGCTWRGISGEFETLDPRYKGQKDPARFFSVRKVFAIS
jgi:hypothetical protein